MNDTNRFSQPDPAYNPRTTCKAVLFDSGNSRLHYAFWDGSRLVNIQNIIYPERVETLQETISSILSDNPCGSVLACSVSGMWRKPLFSHLTQLVPGRFYAIEKPHNVGMTVMYANPDTIGIDRVLAAFAAYRHFNDACVVVGAGTAVTVDAVDESGVFLGGYIFPGLEILAGSLTGKTSLPYVPPSVIPEEIGHSTESCLANAAATGFVGAVDALVKKASRAADCTTNIAVTGGSGSLLYEHLTFEAEYIEGLVLQGLGLVYNTMTDTMINT